MKHSDHGGLRGRLVSGVLVLAALAACGGGGDGNQSPKFQPSRIVSFGDSLSDVGSYNVPKLQAFINDTTLTGSTNSGKFTVNGANAKNWIELIAAQFGVEAPCSAQTGLLSAGPLVDLNTTPVFADGCFAYGQGGARVTDPVGPGNPGLLAFVGGTVHTDDFARGGVLGQLTTPVVTQVQRHLAKASVGGKFSGDELVLLLAGGNDLFVQADKVAKVAAVSPTDAAAIGAASQAAGLAMATAGGEFAQVIMTQIVGKGAKHVVVVNLPDVGLTPALVSSRALGTGLTSAFNSALATGLASAGSAVVLVDAFTQSQDQFARPAQFGLTNVTQRSCDATKLKINTSLACNSATLIAGDTATFLYADDVHPTPYGYKLLAQFVADRLVKAGLL